MSQDDTTSERVRALVAAYGDGSDGSVPTAAQWRALAERPPAPGPTLVNLFKFRGAEGQHAFARYSAVSAPALERVGGRFLLVAPFASTLVGEDEDWDLVAIGQYPDTAAVFALFEDAAYREAFAERRAACERQRVYVIG